MPYPVGVIPPEQLEQLRAAARKAAAAERKAAAAEDELRAAALAAYLAGGSVRQIAKAVGRSIAATHRLLLQARERADVDRD